MAKLLKLRRGTTTQHGSFTGAEGEVTIDTTKDTAVVHDGSTAGGRPLARQDMNNVPAGTIMGTQLENSGVTAGQYGSSSAIPIVTVDAQGLVTAASTTAIDSTTIANGSSSVAVANNGAITSNANHDFSAGIDVTGDITGTTNVDIGGQVEVGSAGTFFKQNQLRSNAPGAMYFDHGTTGQDINFRTSNSSALDTTGLTIKANGNVDFGNGIDVTGNITSTGSATVTQTVSIEGTSPTLNLTDSNANSDFRLNVDGGLFQIRDATNDAYRLKIASDGTVDIGQNLNALGGVDVTGNITVTGTVDGVDVAARDTLFGGLTSSSGVLTTGVTAHTYGATDDSNKVATTAFVKDAITAYNFPSGTKMLFQQTSAPTGWTKITSAVNNKTLRVVSGSVGSGGNVSFTHAFGDRTITANAANTTQGGNISVANTTAGGNVSISSVSTSGTVNSHTLSSNEMPSHQHSVRGNSGANYWGQQNSGGGWHGITNYSYRNANQQYTSGPYTAFNTENTGGGGGHSHGFSGSSHNHTGTLSGSAHTHNASFTGSAHNHSISVTNLDMQVEYLDVIIAEKD